MLALTRRTGQSARVPARFVVVALVLTACTGTAPTAKTVDTIDSTESAGNSYPPVATSATLNCGDKIFSLDAPQDGEEVVGKGIALQTSQSTKQAFQTNRTRDSNPALRLFAKTGLNVRSGVASELIVPDRWVGHLAFNWGGAPPASRLVIGPCSSSSNWTVFAGDTSHPKSDASTSSCVPTMLIARSQSEWAAHVRARPLRVGLARANSDRYTAEDAPSLTSARTADLAHPLQSTVYPRFCALIRTCTGAPDRAFWRREGGSDRAC